MDPSSGHNIKEHNKPLWVSRFMATNNIFTLTETCKLMISPTKREIINCQVVYNLGQLSRDFNPGRLREEEICHGDETNVVINLNTNNTLAFRGDGKVKYADVVIGEEGITLMVTLSGGTNVRMETSFMIFKNATSLPHLEMLTTTFLEYRIAGVPKHG